MKNVLTILSVASLPIFGLVCSGKKTPPPQRSVVTAVYIDKSDPLLHIVNGNYYYGPKLFSGILHDNYAGGQPRHQVSFYNGKEEGGAMMYYADGRLAEKRYYRHGEKQGLHAGWWPNGSPRFEYHFSGGLYHGEYKEWYSSGQLYKLINYTNGIDENGQGWRENGKLFMNYVMRDGRRYGIINSNLCYTVQNEKREFSKSLRTEKNKSKLFSSDSTSR